MSTGWSVCCLSLCTGSSTGTGQYGKVFLHSHSSVGTQRVASVQGGHKVLEEINIIAPLETPLFKIIVGLLDNFKHHVVNTVGGEIAY
jgi:hypothetical protein